MDYVFCGNDAVAAAAAAARTEDILTLTSRLTRFLNELVFLIQLDNIFYYDWSTNVYSYLD